MENRDCGSRTLVGQVDLAAFMAQEQQVGAVFRVLAQIYSTHPRTTQRVLELRRFASA